MDDRERLDDEIDAIDEEIDELYDLPAGDADDEPEGGGVRKQRLDADFLLDRVIPGEIDWRDLVRRHPILSVSLAATVGIVIGRSKCPALLAGVSAALSAAVARQLSDVLDGEMFEF